MRSDLPTGTVTFCFTDVEGSTRLLHALGVEVYAQALAEHRRVIRQVCQSQGGVEVDTQGDAFFFAFPEARGALAAAAGFIEALANGPIQVRVGLHTGTPLLGEEGYVGADVHLASRIAASAHGGQVVLSAQTAALAAASGSEPQALSVLDLGSHRLKDVSEPVAIFQLGDGRFPPLKTIANTNLPSSASSFVGRQEELDEADRLLHSTRMLTVTGPGGQGKTRFCLELATRAREERFRDYGDGVFSCFLASLRDPDLVLATICQTLSVTEQPGLSAVDALAGHLQGRRMLLFLDNLEHLLGASPELSGLLQRAEGLTLLVASREILRIQGETAYALPPLPEDESLALLCERAGVEPSAELSKLAARLEGLPLALELAAARLAVLTPGQLLERLSQRLDLLRGGRDADPRQQTLRATIEWSYELLNAEEQRLFRSLSVFAGGCTLEAAEDVCGADLDSLQSLVDKSLLRFSEGRFWMLETIREFAAVKLRESGQSAEVQGRHARWVLDVAELAEVGMESAEQTEWVHRLEGELANVRAAHAHLEDEKDVSAQLALIGRLWNFWYLRGGWLEARELAAAPLEASRGQRTRERAHALHADAAFAERVGALDDARASAHESLEIYRELGDSKGISWQLSSLAMLAGDDGDLGESERLYEESLRHALAAGDRRTAAFACGNLADLAVRRRQYEAALRQTGDVEQSFRSLGLDQGVHWMMSLRALCLLKLGDTQLADDVARESLEGHLNADVTGVVWDLVVLAECARRRGDELLAASLLGSAASALDQLGIPVTGPEGELYEASVRATRSALGARFDAMFEDGRGRDLRLVATHVLEALPPIAPIHET